MATITDGRIFHYDREFIGSVYNINPWPIKGDRCIIGNNVYVLVYNDLLGQYDLNGQWLDIVHVNEIGEIISVVLPWEYNANSIANYFGVTRVQE